MGKSKPGLNGDGQTLDDPELPDDDDDDGDEGDDIDLLATMPGLRREIF